MLVTGTTKVRYFLGPPGGVSAMLSASRSMSSDRHWASRKLGYERRGRRVGHGTQGAPTVHPRVQSSASASMVGGCCGMAFVINLFSYRAQPVVVLQGNACPILSVANVS